MSKPDEKHTLTVGDICFHEIQTITLQFAFEEARSLIAEALAEKMDVVVEMGGYCTMTVRPGKTALYLKILANGIEVGVHPVLATKDFALEIHGFDPSRGSVTPHIVDCVWWDGKDIAQTKAESMVAAMKQVLKERKEEQKQG